MLKSKLNKIYQNILKWYHNKYTYTPDYIMSLDFSHGFNTYKQAIKLLKKYKNINDMLADNSLKEKFILKFQSKENSKILIFSDNDLYEFVDIKIMEDFINKKNVNESLFFISDFVDSLKSKNNKIDFIKNIKGFYQAILANNKKELFKSTNFINDEFFNIEKISLFDIYSEIQVILKEEILNFHSQYKEEIYKMNKNISFLNNKIVRFSKFNILNTYEENDIKEPDSYYFFKSFCSKEEFKISSKGRSYGISNVYFSQQQRESNTYGYDLKNIDIYNNLQIQQNEFFEILNSFVQIQHIFSIRGCFGEQIAFLSCENNKTNRRIFNPLINKYEELYSLKGDVIVDNNKKQLYTLNMFYTEHTLLHFELKAKSKEKVKEIFDKGFTNYYKKYRLQDSFKNF